MHGVAQTRQIDGAIDVAQFARHPIFHFDLAPVLERSGSSFMRNPERLEVLCRHGLGHLGETDLTLFDGTGFYLIVGSCAGAQAEALANRVNVALLKLFFGTESLSPDQLVTLFRAASPGEIALPNHLATAEQAAATATAAVRDATSKPDEADAADLRARFAGIGEQGFDARTGTSLCFVPVYDLRRHVPVLFLCQPMAVREGQVVYGHAAFGGIEAEHMPYLDDSMLQYAVRFSARLLEAGSVVAVTTPVSVETLGWSRGRDLYRKALQRSGILDHPHIIPTLDDVPPGATAARLAEMIRGLRDHARRIAVMLPDSNIVLERSGALGAAGYILSLPRRSDAPAAGRTAQWLSRLCSVQNAFSCLLDINSEEALEAAKTAAIRFGAGSALAPRALSGDSAVEYAKLLSRASAIPAAQTA